MLVKYSGVYCFDILLSLFVKSLIIGLFSKFIFFTVDFASYTPMFFLFTRPVFIVGSIVEY